ncbi:sulfite exporter TauE/SafE family protein [Niabella sp. CC-SYL272]|uniref:sulfite exporter TauE/SafE family protein n=1 Tax=Niabella agricola TaxID=2891571 RepID=UPI001F286F09|nr:sulfite exporter TauE/SafE family protein [Niabella agricola]MCF3110646.1 sulfite exporter TauE/SafE family protein [Niabella agricola]
MPHWELVIFFAFIAFIYASVGFGGGSSYLAVLALYGLPFKELRLIALICNIIVVCGGVFIYIKSHQVDWKKIVPLVVLSIPLAYLGAILRISQNIYFIILGCSLVVAAILLWTKTRDRSLPVTERSGNQSILKNSALGGAIGFLSGLVGIGGGIFLSPVLNLMKWDAPKKIAAAASVFILVNSASGIAGQLTQLPGNMNHTRIILLGLAVFIGGQAGSRMSVRFDPLIIKRLTALLVFFAGIEVLVKHL